MLSFNQLDAGLYEVFLRNPMKNDHVDEINFVAQYLALRAGSFDFDAYEYGIGKLSRKKTIVLS